MKKLFAISLALILALGMFSVAAAEDVITIGFAQVGHESDWRAANTSTTRTPSPLRTATSCSSWTPTTTTPLRWKLSVTSSSRKWITS